MDNGKAWLVPLSGVVFLVLVVLAFLIGGEPPDPSEDQAQEIVDFYVDDKDSVMIGAVLQTLAATFLVFFGGALYRVLRAAQGASGAAAAVALAGLVIVAIGIAIDGTINFALAETADDIDPSAVQALSALWSNDFLPLALGTQVFLIALAVSSIRRGALPKWIGWIALLLGIIAVTPIGFISFLAAGPLVAIISVLMTLRARGSDRQARQTTPPPATT